MNIEGVNIECLGHASVRVENKVIIYVDPYVLDKNPKKADIILITHEHFDHCAPDKVSEIQKEDTVIVTTPASSQKLSGDIRVVKPGDTLNIKGVYIEVVPAYNIDKFRTPGVPFHPQEDEKLGFIFTINEKRIYHAGDTDKIPEMEGMRVDIAMLPIGGTYTMDEKEAAEAAKIIKPKVVIPIHYNYISNTDADPEKFKILLEGTEIKVEILSKI
jgi:L-ascorbate metabolism protein UlaG (beta-lactamase superfamily)